MYQRDTDRNIKIDNIKKTQENICQRFVVKKMNKDLFTTFYFFGYIGYPHKICKKTLTNIMILHWYWINEQEQSLMLFFTQRKSLSDYESHATRAKSWPFASYIHLLSQKSLHIESRVVESLFFLGWLRLLVLRRL